MTHLQSMTRHNQRRRSAVKLALFLAFVVGVRRGYVRADASRRSRAVRTTTPVTRTQDVRQRETTAFSTNADDDARTPTPGRARVEYDGTLIASASTVGHTRDDAACEAACARTRGCNVWVRGRSSGACWLKRRERASEDVRVMSEGEHCAWNSGTLDKDYVRDASEVLSTVVKTAGTPNASEYATLAVDGFGRARLKLRPEWHRESVEYLRALAVEPDACEGTCEMYRVEPGFLVQGTLKSASVAANSATKDGPRLMVRGDVGWAGEGPGPDFFVYLGEKPADWLGKKHTVFAEVADEGSLAVLERVVNAPSSTPGGPGTMRFIDVRPSLRVSLD